MSNKAAKLSFHDIQQLRHDYATGKATQGQLARRHKISVIQVGRITRRECWQNVPDVDLTQADLDQTLQRLLTVQDETNASKKMQEAIAAGKAEARKGDDYLNELTGELNGTNKPTGD